MRGEVGLRGCGCSGEGGALSAPLRVQILSAPIMEVLIPACLIREGLKRLGVVVEGKAVGSLQAELICSCLLLKSHDRPG